VILTLALTAAAGGAVAAIYTAFRGRTADREALAARSRIRPVTTSADTETDDDLEGDNQ
jgi:hypothetical protein